jgi:tetratricopeptide (TPR) repeat protein
VQPFPVNHLRMSARARVVTVVALAAAVAALATVGATLLVSRGQGTVAPGAVGKPRPGAPPLELDLGTRADSEARALARASALYGKGRRHAAGTIFGRYASLDARIGSAFAAWPHGSLDEIKRLVAANPHSSLAVLHLGLAYYWSGRTADAVAAWRIAESAQPDTPAAVHASDLLHPRLPVPGLPPFTPSFGPPAAIARLPPAAELAALARAARQPDARAKLLYGVALQRLGRRVSAERQFAAAAALAPHDPEMRVAAAVGRFTKAHPEQAFSRLGPLVRVFPHAVTVRFHLGVLLLWLGDVKKARVELRLAHSEAPNSPLGREAKSFLSRLASIGTK